MNAPTIHMHGQWGPPPDALDLVEGEVHVWRLSLVAPAAGLEGLRAVLSPDERARADRFIRAEHGLRFTMARASLRALLGRYLNIEPERIQFEYGEHGKPALSRETHDAGLQFNVAHSGDIGLVAISLNQTVGVDIERYRERLESEKIATRYFSPDEVSRLFALPPADREGAFYRCWATKEAYMKARGEGLSLGLDSFDVTFEADRPPALLRAKGGTQEVERWAFVALEVCERYAAVCAVERPVDVVRCWAARVK